MARNVNNIFLRGISGSVGAHQYIRCRGGVEYIVNKPVRPKDRKPKPAEELGQNRFRKAQLYGQMVIADPLLKACYSKRKKGAQTEYNLAISDAMQDPSITGHDCSGYSGKVGDILKVEATDDHLVVRVRCRITTLAGELVEEGEAFPTDKYEEWAYTLTRSHPSAASNTIEFTAEDKPGNTAKLMVRKE